MSTFLVPLIPVHSDRASLIASASRLLLVAVFAIGVGPGSAGAATPSSDGPNWSYSIKLSDGRTLVSDGALAIDTAIAKPAELPAKVVGEVGAKRIEDQMNAPATDEFSLTQMKSNVAPGHYVSPSGVQLNGLYVNYLRGKVSASKVKFRTKGELQPVAILLDGKPVGVVMPMKR